jgi:hypothetical protein
MTYRICYFFLSLFMVNQSQAQTQQQKISNDLDRLTQTLESGIYERIVDLGYVPSPFKYRRKATITAHNELTMLIMRFSDFTPTPGRKAYIGKVFIGERYLERDYNRKYNNQAAYKTDLDGLWVACKLYFDERSLEYRLNVYPDHPILDCRKNARPFKGTHFNRSKCTSVAQHWESMQYVLRLSDKHFEDFSLPDNTDSTRNFLKAADQNVNIDRTYFSDKDLQTETDTFPFVPNNRQRNLIREINLRKQIKIFKVAFIDDALSANMGRTLTLRYTKYALSDDFIEGNGYTFNLHSFNEMDSQELKDRSRPNWFVSRNPLYRSLIMGNEPDDTYIPGIIWSRSTQFAFLAGDIYQAATGNTPARRTEQKTQDNALAIKQKQVYSRDSAYVEAQPPNGIIPINNNRSRKTYWVYGGPANKKPLSEGKTIRLAPVQYLRDTLPQPFFAGGVQFWQKGRICLPLKAKTDRTLHYDYVTEPDAKEWIIRQAETLPKNSPRAAHIWYRVELTDPKRITSR